MNTQERVLAMLNKVQKAREVKKENLGAIEDAIKNEVDRLENSAQDYIQQSLDLYSIIEDFRANQNDFISKLSQANNINMDAVYSLIEDFNLAKSEYNADVSNMSILGLEDVESVVDACSIIVRGLEAINTPGLG